MQQKTDIKTFVLDTNVLLHDSGCLLKFGDNNLVVPLPVIEELDKFKNGSEEINFHARQAIKTIDRLCNEGDGVFNGGIEIAPGLGKIRIVLAQPLSKVIESNFTIIDADTQIINIALWLKNQEGAEVVIVSKDANLRVRARAVGVKAEDFLNDKIRDEAIVSKVAFELNISQDKIKQLYGNSPLNYEIPGALPNQYFIVKNGSSSVLATYRDGFLYKLAEKNKLSAMNIHPKNSEQLFAMDALLNPDISIVTIEGSAGTGKTILSVACGLAQIQTGTYDNLLFTRQTISVGNKDIGFLPGDIKDKINPFMAGMFDNLSFIKSKNHEDTSFISDLTTDGRLVIEPLSFIRGRSLHRDFLIVDEAQNLTLHEVKTIITRAGQGTKIVLIGDTGQIDTPFLDKRSNGLSIVIEKFLGQKCFSHIHLIKGERSALATLAGDLL